jgi:glycerol-3-phosphate dehydrogenase
LEVPDEQVRAMYREGAKLVPAVASAAERAAWSAARPLIGASGGQGGRSRAVADLQVLRPRRHRRRGGFVTITGGKATTLRAMAEGTADLVCAKLGVVAPCWPSAP